MFNFEIGKLYACVGIGQYKRNRYEISLALLECDEKSARETHWVYNSPSYRTGLVVNGHKVVGLPSKQIFMVLELATRPSDEGIPMVFVISGEHVGWIKAASYLFFKEVKK